MEHEARTQAHERGSTSDAAVAFSPGRLTRPRDRSFQVGAL